MADNKVNFLRGTSAEYEAKTKDNDTFYYTTDTKKLYLGETEITGGGVTIDNALSDTSKNPVQNKVVKAALDNKADLSDIPTSLPANGGNADTLGGIVASELERVRTAIVGGETVGSTFTALQARNGDKILRIQVDITTGFERIMLCLSTDGGATWTEIPLGNAATFNGLSPSSFSQNLGIWSTGSVKDLILAADTSGFVWIHSGVTDMPIDNTYWFGILNCNTVHRCLRITQLGSGKNYTLTYNASNSAWHGWTNDADGGTIASTTSSGIVSTGTQHFGGYKTFPMVGLRTTGTVGTQPSSDINTAIYFTNADVNAPFGIIKNCIRNTTFTTGEVFTSLGSYSNDRTGTCELKVVATNNNSGNYVTISNPTVSSSASCLRKLASGTANATTSNCPSGAWYGKHS